MLVLASASPRRRELLTQAGYSFEVHPAHIPEELLPNEDPIAYVTRLAREKAQAVYNEIMVPQVSILKPGKAQRIMRAKSERLPHRRCSARTPPSLSTTTSSASPKAPQTPPECSACSPDAPSRSHRRRAGHRNLHRSRSRSHRRHLPHPHGRRDRFLHRHRRTDGQSRRLRHSGSRRPLGSPH